MESLKPTNHMKISLSVKSLIPPTALVITLPKPSVNYSTLTQGNQAHTSKMGFGKVMTRAVGGIRDFTEREIFVWFVGFKDSM